jgi:shikimate dehydrogenase
MKRACVIGWPVAHSRSPLIHGYWLRRYGIDGSYTKQPVRPDDVVSFLRALGEQGFEGCNVTVPYKETAYATAVEKSPAARAVAAANTLWLEGDRLVGDNTDGVGFMAHLQASVPGLDLTGRVVSVLGAGGAARAVIHAVLGAGAREVRVFNRTRSRADSIASHFGERIEAHDWSEREPASRDAALLVNATTLGMRGSDWLDFDVAGLDSRCVVFDIVYVPLETPLLLAAQARGLATVDGLGMLLHQAVPGFERWFGVRPEVTDELRAILVRDIEGA